MNPNSDVELANTRRKLSRLEAHYENRRKETGGNAHVRELSMRSLKKYINQFKEEIARCEAHQPMRRKHHDLKNESELENTRKKLELLEEIYENARKDHSGDAHARELSMHSVKQMINQLSEEIARYEAHQPAEH